MDPGFFPHADVFAQAHIGEDLTVNQFWDVRSDVCLCSSASSALKRNWIHFGCLFLRWRFKYATINKDPDGFSAHGVLFGLIEKTVKSHYP